MWGRVLPGRGGAAGKQQNQPGKEHREHRHEPLVQWQVDEQYLPVGTEPEVRMMTSSVPLTPPIRITNDVNLDAHSTPEFCEFRWVDPELLPELIVPFKKRVYRAVLEGFRELV